MSKNKNYFNNICSNTLYTLSFLLLILFPLSGKEDHRIETQKAALEEAASLPNRGTLMRKDNGFVYLDVPNDFITSVAPLLELPGELRTRPTAKKSIGAHISVFQEQENVLPEELGKTFSFTVRDIRSFTLHSRDGSKKLWVISLNSPELENLRQKYGCSPKLKGFDFHITLGKQMPAAPANWEKTEEISAFNFSEEPTLGLETEGDFVVVEANDLLKTAAKVDAIGQLHLKGNGFVYLDVSNNFIDDIHSSLPVKGEFTPISTKPKQMGAHISVILEDEMIENEIWNLSQAGEWFNFEVKQLRFIERKTAKGKTRLWLLAADSPGLERLRKHYGLKPKLKGHDFHITLGTEKTDSSLEKNTAEWFDLEDLFEFENSMSL